MEARRRTWFDERGLTIAGAGAGAERHLPFYAGAMHYWRVAPTRWAACLRAVHDLGLTIVETYVPWRVHEAAERHVRVDRASAISRASSRSRARPGSRSCCARGRTSTPSCTSFGIPDYVLADPAVPGAHRARHPGVDAGAAARVPDPVVRERRVPRAASTPGTPRSPRSIAPHLAPDGPVVALGVDNEAQLFFRLGAYDLDYHPDAIDLVARGLRARRGRAARVGSRRRRALHRVGPVQGPVPRARARRVRARAR